MKEMLKFVIQLLVVIFLSVLLVRYNILFFDYYIIGFTLYFLVSIILIGIGVFQIKRDEPVGFSGEKAPKKEYLSDVESWNKKHGIMWITYGIAITCSFSICVFVGNFIASIIFVGASIGTIPIMWWYHRCLKKKYII